MRGGPRLTTEQIAQMRVELCAAFDAAGVEYGECCCGCSERTPLAKINSRTVGWVKGEPKRYVQRHGRPEAPDGPGPNPEGLCMCGCGERTSPARQTIEEWGHVKGRPVRYRPGHHRRILAPGYEVAESGCWEWRGFIDQKGYGVTKVYGQTFKAHRLIYEREHAPIPEGHHLHHECGNRRCVNPGHLDPMTPEAHAALHRHEAVVAA